MFILPGAEGVFYKHENRSPRSGSAPPAACAPTIRMQAGAAHGWCRPDGGAPVASATRRSPSGVPARRGVHPPLPSAPRIRYHVQPNNGVQLTPLARPYPGRDFFGKALWPCATPTISIPYEVLVRR